jgi:hypothetical protein
MFMRINDSWGIPHYNKISVIKSLQNYYSAIGNITKEIFGITTSTGKFIKEVSDGLMKDVYSFRQKESKEK